MRYKRMRLRYFIRLVYDADVDVVCVLSVGATIRRETAPLCYTEQPNCVLTSHEHYEDPDTDNNRGQWAILACMLLEYHWGI